MGSAQDDIVEFSETRQKVNMYKITIGNLRYLYGLDWNTTNKLANELSAIVDKNIFSSYNYYKFDNNNIYKYIHSIFINININNKLINIPSHLYVNHEDIIENALFSAEKASNDILYRDMHYINSPTHKRFRVNNPIEYIFYIISCCMLDTSIVDLNDAIFYLKKLSYDPPTRQHFEKHKYLPISWNDFETALKLCHANKLPQGGSRKQTDKIEATKATCERVLNQILGSNPEPHRLSRGIFIENVKTSMESAGNGILFQISTAKDFFRDNEQLSPYKRQRGHPLKNR